LTVYPCHYGGNRGAQKAKGIFTRQAAFISIKRLEVNRQALQTPAGQEEIFWKSKYNDSPP
jgi:hypothetical protein